VLGLLEAGFFPGSVYLLSTWYVRYDVHKRFSAFYFFGMLASAVSGLLGYGFTQMEGVANIRGWRWIFIIEGIFTVLISVIGFVFLVAFPEKAHMTWRFLDERETKWVIDRLNRDRGDATVEPFNVWKFAACALDIKLWLLGCYSSAFYARRMPFCIFSQQFSGPWVSIQESLGTLQAHLTLQERFL
jgi:MFS family permease